MERSTTVFYPSQIQIFRRMYFLNSFHDHAFQKSKHPSQICIIGYWMLIINFTREICSHSNDLMKLPLPLVKFCTIVALIGGLYPWKWQEDGLHLSSAKLHIKVDIIGRWPSSLLSCICGCHSYCLTCFERGTRWPPL